MASTQSFSASSTPGTGGYSNHFRTGKYSVIFSLKSRYWQVLSHNLFEVLQVRQVLNHFQLQVLQVLASTQSFSASSTPSTTGEYSIISILNCSRYWLVLSLFPLQALQVVTGTQSFSAPSTQGTGRCSVVLSLKYYCTISLCYGSLIVRIGLDETSCSGRMSSPVDIPRVLGVPNRGDFSAATFPGNDRNKKKTHQL